MIKKKINKNLLKKKEIRMGLIASGRRKRGFHLENIEVMNYNLKTKKFIIKTLSDIYKFIDGNFINMSNNMNKKNYRSELKINRSPHVNSKSKESFRFKYFTSVWSSCFRYNINKKVLNMLKKWKVIRKINFRTRVNSIKLFRKYNTSNSCIVNGGKPLSRAHPMVLLTIFSAVDFNFLFLINFVKPWYYYMYRNFSFLEDILRFFGFKVDPRYNIKWDYSDTDYYMEDYYNSAKDLEYSEVYEEYWKYIKLYQKEIKFDNGHIITNHKYNQLNSAGVEPSWSIWLDQTIDKFIKDTGGSIKNNIEFNIDRVNLDLYKNKRHEDYLYTRIHKYLHNLFDQGPFSNVMDNKFDLVKDISKLNPYSAINKQVDLLEENIKSFQTYDYWYVTDLKTNENVLLVFNKKSDEWVDVITPGQYLEFLESSHFLSIESERSLSSVINFYESYYYDTSYQRVTNWISSYIDIYPQLTDVQKNHYFLQPWPNEPSNDLIFTPDLLAWESTYWKDFMWSYYQSKWYFYVNDSIISAVSSQVRNWFEISDYLRLLYFEHPHFFVLTCFTVFWLCFIIALPYIYFLKGTYYKNVVKWLGDHGNHTIIKNKKILKLLSIFKSNTYKVGILFYKLEKVIFKDIGTYLYGFIRIKRLPIRPVFERLNLFKPTTNNELYEKYRIRTFIKLWLFGKIIPAKDYPDFLRWDPKLRNSFYMYPRTWRKKILDPTLGSTFATIVYFIFSYLLLSPKHGSIDHELAKYREYFRVYGSKGYNRGRKAHFRRKKRYKFKRREYLWKEKMDEFRLKKYFNTIENSIGEYNIDYFKPKYREEIQYVLDNKEDHNLIADYKKKLSKTASKKNYDKKIFREKKWWKSKWKSKLPENDESHHPMKYRKLGYIARYEYKNYRRTFYNYYDWLIDKKDYLKLYHTNKKIELEYSYIKKKVDNLDDIADFIIESGQNIENLVLKDVDKESVESYRDSDDFNFRQEAALMAYNKHIDILTYYIEYLDEMPDENLYSEPNLLAFIEEKLGTLNEADREILNCYLPYFKDYAIKSQKIKTNLDLFFEDILLNYVSILKFYILTSCDNLFTWFPLVQGWAKFLQKKYNYIQDLILSFNDWYNYNFSSFYRISKTVLYSFIDFINYIIKLFYNIENYIFLFIYNSIEISLYKFPMFLGKILEKPEWPKWVANTWYHSLYIGLPYTKLLNIFSENFVNNVKSVNFTIYKYWIIYLDTCANFLPQIWNYTYLLFFNSCLKGFQYILNSFFIIKDVEHNSYHWKFFDYGNIFKLEAYVNKKMIKIYNIYVEGGDTFISKEYFNLWLEPLYKFERFCCDIKNKIIYPTSSITHFDQFVIINKSAFISDITNLNFYSFIYRLRFLLTFISDIIVNFVNYWFIALKSFFLGLYDTIIIYFYINTYRFSSLFSKYYSIKHDIESASHYNVSLDHYNKNYKNNDEFYYNFKDTLVNPNKFFIRYNEKNEICMNLEKIEKDIPGLFLYLTSDPIILTKLNASKTEIVMDVESFKKLNLSWFDMNLLQQWYCSHHTNQYVEEEKPVNFDFIIKEENDVFYNRSIFDLKLNFDSFLSNYIYLMFRFKEIFLTIREDLSRLFYKVYYFFLGKYSYFFNEKYKFKAQLKNERVVMNNYRGYTKSRYIPTTAEKLYYKKRVDKEGSFGTFSNYWVNLQVEYNILKMYYSFTKKYFKKYFKEHYLEVDNSNIRYICEKFYTLTTPIRYIRENGYINTFMFCLKYPNKKEFVLDTYESILNFLINIPENIRSLEKYYSKLQKLYNFLLNSVASLIDILSVKISSYIFKMFSFIFEFYYYFFFLVFFHTARLLMAIFTYIYYILYYIYKPLCLIIEDLYTCFLFFSNFLIVHSTVLFKENLNLFTWKCIDFVKGFFLFIYDFPINLYVILKEWKYLLVLYYRNLNINIIEFYNDFINLYLKYISLKIIYISNVEINKNFLRTYYSFIELWNKPSIFLETWATYRLLQLVVKHESQYDQVRYTYARGFAVFNNKILREDNVYLEPYAESVTEKACYFYLDVLKQAKWDLLNNITDIKELNFYRLVYILKQHLIFNYYILMLNLNVHLTILKNTYTENKGEGYKAVINKLIKLYTRGINDYQELYIYFKDVLKYRYELIIEDYNLALNYFSSNSFLITLFYPIYVIKEFILLYITWFYLLIRHAVTNLGFFFSELIYIQNIIFFIKAKFPSLFLNSHFYPILVIFDIIKGYLSSYSIYYYNFLNCCTFLKNYILERYYYFYKGSYSYDILEQKLNFTSLTSFDKYYLTRFIQNDNIVEQTALIDYLKLKELSSSEVMHLMQQAESYAKPEVSINNYVDRKLGSIYSKINQIFYFLPNKKNYRGLNNVLNVDHEYRDNLAKYFTNTWYEPDWALAKRSTLLSSNTRLSLNTKRATDYWLFYEDHIKTYNTLQEIYFKDYLDTYPLTTDEEVLKNLGINNNLERNLYLISCWYEHRYIHDAFQMNAFKYQYKYKRYWDSLIESPKTYQSFFNDNSLKLRYLENFYFYVSDVQALVQKDVDWKQYNSIDGISLKDDAPWDIRMPRLKDYLLEFKYIELTFSFIINIVNKVKNYFEYYLGIGSVNILNANANHYILGYAITFFYNIFNYFLKLLKIVINFFYRLIYLYNAILEDISFFYNYFNKYFEYRFGVSLDINIFNLTVWFDHFIYWLYDIPKHKWKDLYKMNLFYNNWKFSKETEDLLKYYIIDRHEGLFYTFSQGWWAFYRDAWSLRTKSPKIYHLGFWLHEGFLGLQKETTLFINKELGLFNWDANKHEDFSSYIILRWAYGIKFIINECFMLFLKGIEVTLCLLFDIYVNFIGFTTLFFKSIFYYIKDVVPMCIYDIQSYLFNIIYNTTYYLWNTLFYNIFSIFNIIVKDCIRKITVFFKSFDISSFEISSLHFNVYFYFKDSILIRLKVKNEELLWELYTCFDNVMWSFKDLIRNDGIFNFIADFIYFISNTFLMFFRTFYVLTGSQPFLIITMIVNDIIDLILLKTPILFIYYNIVDYINEALKSFYIIFTDKIRFLVFLDHIVFSIVDFTIELIDIIRYGICCIIDQIFFVSFWSGSALENLFLDLKVGFLLIFDDTYRILTNFIKFIKSPIDSLLKVHMSYIEWRFNLNNDGFWWFNDIIKVFILDKIFIVVKWFYTNFNNNTIKKRFFMQGDFNRNLPKLIGEDWNKLNDFEKRWYTAIYTNNNKEDVSNLSTSFDYLIESPIKNESLKNKAEVKSLDSYPEYKIVKLIEDYKISLELLGVPLELEKKLVFRYLFFLNAQIESSRPDNSEKTELFKYLSPSMLPSLSTNLHWPFWSYRKRIKEYVFNFLNIKLRKDFTQVFNSSTSNKAYDKEVVKIILNSYSSFYYGHDFDDLVNFYWKAQYFRNYDILKEYLMLHIDQVKAFVTDKDISDGVTRSLDHEGIWSDKDFLDNKKNLINDPEFNKNVKNLTYKEINKLVTKLEFLSKNEPKKLPDGTEIPDNPFSKSGFFPILNVENPNTLFFPYHANIAPENFRSDVLFKDPWVWETETFGNIGETLSNANVKNHKQQNQSGASVDNYINRDQFDVFVRELIRQDNLKKQFKREFLNAEYLYHRGRMYNWFSRQKNLIEKYKFFEWNQKTYNYYTDNFGKVFGFIYYHFPGQSLYYKDKFYNTYESVSLVFNFLSKKPSIFSPTNIVNRVNNYDFKTFFISAENYSRFNKYHRDFNIDSLSLGGWNHGIHGYPLTYIQGNKIPNLEFFVNKYLDFNRYLIMTAIRFRKESSNMKHRSILDHRVVSKSMVGKHVKVNKTKLEDRKNLHKQQLNAIYGERRSKYYKYYLHSLKSMTERPIVDRPSFPYQIKNKKNKDRENLSKYLYRPYWHRPSLAPRKKNRRKNKSFIFDDQFKVNLPKTKFTEKLYRSLQDNLNLKLNLAVKDLYYKKYQKYHTRRFPLYNSKKYKEFLKKEHPSYDTTKGYIDFVKDSEKLINEKPKTFTSLLLDANKYSQSEFQKLMDLQRNLKKNVSKHNLYWLKEAKNDIKDLETFKLFGSSLNKARHKYIQKPYYKYAVKKDNITDEMSELYTKTQRVKLATGRYFRKGLTTVLPTKMIRKRYKNFIGIGGRNKFGRYPYLKTRRYQRKGYFGGKKGSTYRRPRWARRKDRIKNEDIREEELGELNYLKDHQKISLTNYWKNLDKEYLKNKIDGLDYQKLSLNECDREFYNKVKFLKKYGSNNVKPEWFENLEMLRNNRKSSKGANDDIVIRMQNRLFDLVNRKNTKDDPEGYRDLFYKDPDFFTNGGFKVDGKVPKVPYEDTDESYDYHNVLSAIVYIAELNQKIKDDEYFRYKLNDNSSKEKATLVGDKADLISPAKKAKTGKDGVREGVQSIRKKYYDFFVDNLNTYDKDLSIGAILWHRYVDDLSFGSRMMNKNNLSYQNFIIHRKMALDDLRDSDLNSEEDVLKYLSLKNYNNVYKFNTLDDDVLTHFAALDLKAKKKYRRSKNFYDLYDRVKSYPISPVKKYRKVYNQLGEESLFFNIDYNPSKQGKWSLFENITYLPAFGWKGTNYLVKQNNSISWNYSNHLFDTVSDYFYKSVKYQRGITKKRGERRHYAPKFRKYKRFRSLLRDEDGEPTLTWGGLTYKITNSMNFKESAYLNDWISLYTQDVLSSSANIYFRNLKNKTRYSLTKAFKRDSFLNNNLNKHKIFDIKDIDWTKVQKNVITTNDFEKNKNFIDEAAVNHIEYDDNGYMDYFWDMDPSVLLNQQTLYNKKTGEYENKRFISDRRINEYKDTDMRAAYSFYDFNYEEIETPDLAQWYADFELDYRYWYNVELWHTQHVKSSIEESEHWNVVDAKIFPWTGMREDSIVVLEDIDPELGDIYYGMDDTTGDSYNDYRFGLFTDTQHVHSLDQKMRYNNEYYNEIGDYVTYKVESEEPGEQITSGWGQSDINLKGEGSPYVIKPTFPILSYTANENFENARKKQKLVEGLTSAMLRGDPQTFYSKMFQPNKFGYANDLESYQRESNRGPEFFFNIQATDPYRKSYSVWTDNRDSCLVPPRIAIKASTNFPELTNGDWSNDSLLHLINASGTAYVNNLPKDALKRYNNYNNYLTDNLFEYVNYYDKLLGFKTNQRYMSVASNCYTEPWESSSDDSTHIFKDIRKSWRYLAKRVSFQDTFNFVGEYHIRTELPTNEHPELAMYQKEQEREDIETKEYAFLKRDDRVYNTFFKDLLNPKHWRPISSETYQQLKLGPLRFFSGYSIENLFNGKATEEHKDNEDGHHLSHKSQHYNYSLEGLVTLKEQILENNINSIYDIVPKLITELKDSSLNNISNFIYPSIRYDVASVNSVYLDIFYNNLIYRERVYSKPSCYHYWVFYDNGDNVFNSFNSSKNLNLEVWNWCTAFDWQFGFQDPATPIMEGIIDLHHDLLFILIIVCVFVLWLLILIVFSFVPRTTYLHYIFNLILSELVLEVFEILQSFCNLVLKLISWFNKKSFFTSKQDFLLNTVLNFYLYLNNKKYYFLYRTTQIDSNIQEMNNFFGKNTENNKLVSKNSIKKINVWFPQTFTHNNVIEILWTIVPVLILISIAIPSFSLLYATDQIWNPVFTIKVLGNQWYWSYEYC